MLDPQVLARILILQNMVGNLPDQESIFSFVCRGLTDIPGIRRASFFPVGALLPEGSGLCKPIQMGDSVFGHLVLEIFDQAQYSTYQPYVENFCFMIAVILEERHHRDQIERHKAELENTVLERTRELESELAARRKAEATLRESKERLAVTLRSIGDGVITTDLHGLVDGMNRVAEALTGWSAAEASGKTLPEVFPICHELTGTPCENPVDQVLKTHRIVSLANHTVLVSRDGQRRVIEDSGAPIFDTESRIIGVVLVFRDNTEKRKLLESVERNEKLHSLGILAGGIAHDFNNLLGGLFGYLRLAMDASEEGSPGLSYLQRSFPVYERAKALTQQLLTFSKGGHPVLRSGDLGKTLQSSVEFALSGSNVVARFHIAADLWPGSYDENQIGQVIDNLVINAKEAMPRGGIVEVWAENCRVDAGFPGLVPGPYVLITIRDHGPGIPRDTLGKIFDPFFTTKAKGSGLGLATSYSIVARHDGLIEVQSEVGQGTTFTIHLPATSQAASEPPLQDKAAPHKSLGRVLVLDDEEFLLEVTKAMLESMGYSVAAATNGQGALKLLTEPDREPFRFVLTDLTVPGGMGGVEILAELRKRGEQTPVIATSGYFEDPIIADPARFGFAGSLAKPYLAEDLAALLNRTFH